MPKNPETEIEELLAIVSHDLQSPLSAIRCCSELILEDNRIKNAPDLLKILKTIRDSAHSSFELIDNLLSYSKLSKHKLEAHIGPCDIHAIINELILLLGPLAEKKGIQISLHNQLADQLIEADSFMIRQIISNLLSNAIKFSLPKTNVRIELKKKGSENAIISICDEGPGIDKEDQKELFNKFSKLKNKPTGGERSTGLGLAIVKKFTEMNKGTIHCTSSLGMGSTFSCQFPIKQ